MSRLSRFALRVAPLGLAVLPAACRGTAGAEVPRAEQAAACEGFDALADLANAMQTSATFGHSSDLFYLVDADQELGYVNLAEKRLADAKSAEARAMGAQIVRFGDTLAQLRHRMGDAMATLERTGEAADSALDAAAMCKGVDLRDPSKVAGKEGAVDLEKTRAANRAKASSKACESALRLWTSAQTADLTSEVTSSAIASHITQLTLPGERAPIRDRLAVALTAHAKALREFHTFAAPKAGKEIDEAQALIAIRSDLLKSLDAANRTCRDPLREVKQVVGGEPEPRRATVTVRPKWSGSLATLPHPEEFGSGFVVRWRNASGQLEARVVTNNHVMDGAYEADISTGDEETDKTKAIKPNPSDKKTSKWSATLIQANPHDDIAVLRLDPTSQSAFTEGFAFRLAPAREEEPVIAAGFPGVGARPSFQVTKGTVSNAKFGAEGEDASPLDAYVQHTAPIDPGNSGGPLLDAHGKLLGMNTYKVVGRENVGLAIPSWRIEEALIRAERPVSLDQKHAEASCNAVVAALESRNPAGAAASRFGLALYDWAISRSSDTEAAGYGERFQGQPTGPADIARRRAYGALRERVEAEKGVRRFETCSEVRADETPGRFVGTFHTRTATHTLYFGEEHAAMRVVEFK
jgi:S1-C subfamily serine protease